MPTTHEFFTRQHEALTRLETSIVKTQREMEAARSETLANLAASRQEAEQTAAAFQEKIGAAVARMRASVDAREHETDVAIARWKQDRELDKLDARAQAAEAYADAAMAVFRLAQEESSAASVDAVMARRDADEAKKAVAGVG
jgi:hypothetical protein